MSGPLTVDIAGCELGTDERERLLHPLVGQVILFARNFEAPVQLARLCAQIHALRDPPLLIVADQEGGRVQRFRTGFTPIAPMADLGARWRVDPIEACRLARTAGFVLAAELRAHGVDLALAPVLDLAWGRSAVIGERAFDADPRVVTLLGGHLMHGLALAGMACCGKHFPGHGWAEADSHSGLATDERSLAEIVEHDAAPYRDLGPALAAVMPAHVIYRAVDPRPAGFSPVWINDVLRSRLGFDGAVISDDLSMHGAAYAGDIVERSTLALAAGCDLIHVCNDRAGADRVIDRLRWAAGPQFESRRRRLLPRGEPPDEADPVYRRARAALLRWNEGES
jgi:beta-N-acetylhexosaminidase